MANVIKTVLTYQLDGSTRDFNIPFEYLARKFVVVTLIGVDRKVLTLNTDYRFATRTTISLTKAWGPADGYTTVELRRVTSTTDRLVDFTDGSILRAYDLNVAQIQTMHVAEEARDLTADTIGVNNDGHLDARGRRIVNLANAVDDRDAVPFGQLKTMNQNSWQARNEALQFRNEAETFRNQAEGFKTESGTNATKTNQWRNEAEGFRDEAEQFKNTATQQATAAGNSATAARQSEVNAANSAKESANSATLAEQQADRAKTEADKLGNWNELAGLIESSDGGSSSVRWKADDIKVLNQTTPEFDRRSYISRWESEGANGTIGAYRNEVDGGLVVHVREDRYTNAAKFYLVGDGTINTGRVITRLDSGKDPIGYPSSFSQSVLIRFNGSRCRYHSNGDIVWEEGNNIFANANSKATSLGSALISLREDAVHDVWLGASEWISHPKPPVGSRIDWALHNGSVCTGYTQWRDDSAVWLDGMFARKVWIMKGSGAKRVIVSV